jgi:hypothetical protein
MFVLFRYDPGEASRSHEHHHSQMALKAELGRVGAFLSRISAYRSTRAAAATLAAIGFGVLEDASHNLVLSFQLHPALKAMADGFIVAASGGTVVWLMLTGLSRRRQTAVAQSEAAGELNGEVRNALQVILHASQNAPAGDRRMLVESVERIESTLQRLNPLLPSLENRMHRAEEAHAHQVLSSVH